MNTSQGYFHPLTGFNAVLKPHNLTERAPSRELGTRHALPQHHLRRLRLELGRQALHFSTPSFCLAFRKVITLLLHSISRVMTFHSINPSFEFFFRIFLFIHRRRGTDTLVTRTVTRLLVNDAYATKFSYHIRVVSLNENS